MIDCSASTLPAPFKSCACGKCYTYAEWQQLELVSPRWDVGGDGVDVFEVRNCTCGSTITIEVP